MRYRYRVDEESDLCGSSATATIQSQSEPTAPWCHEQSLPTKTVMLAVEAAEDWIARQEGWVYP
jgi:hypothetical protein